MATVTTILGLAIFCCAVVAENESNNGDLLLRKKRFPGSSECLFHTIGCNEKPFEYCKSGVCLSVEEVLTPAPECVAICGPAESTNNSSNIGATTPVPTGLGLNETVDMSVNASTISPEEENNRTISGNETDTWPATQTPSPDATTKLHWTDDPTYCAANYPCLNGGYCDPEFKKLVASNLNVRCICADGYTGQQCQDECSLDCPTNSSCNILNGVQSCTCPYGSDIQGCEYFSTTQQPFQPNHPIWFYSVISFAALLLFVLLVYIILLKLRWRSLLVTKMFHSLQPYEDGDEKLFDAFISFISCNKDFTQSADDRFVYRVLRPILEEESSYKLCIHQRDFPPGEDIANNIIWAVENSRRTILVLSPLYLESGWTRLEYQKALEEMAKRRHKIIPIIFEDISHITIEDTTLEKILSSVTYIKYPKASEDNDTKRFWSMLRMALPKLRSVDIEKSPRLSTTTSTVETATGDRQTGPPLNSQESLQSTITDITDVPMEIRSEDKNAPKDAVVDINDVDKMKAISGIKQNKNHKNMNKNAEKYIAVLDAVH